MASNLLQSVEVMTSNSSTDAEQARVFKIVSYQIGPRYLRRLGRLLGFTTYQLNQIEQTAHEKRCRLNKMCEHMLNEWKTKKPTDFDWKEELKTAMETLGRHDILQNINTDYHQLFDLVTNNLDPQQLRVFGRHLGLTTYDLDILETYFLQHEVPRQQWYRFILKEWLERKSPATNGRKEIVLALKNMCEGPDKLSKHQTTVLLGLYDKEVLPSFSDYHQPFETISENVDDLSLTALAKQLGLEESWLDDLLKYWYTRGYTRREMCFNLLEEWLWKGGGGSTNDGFDWKKILTEALVQLKRNDLVDSLSRLSLDQSSQEEKEDVPSTPCS